MALETLARGSSEELVATDCQLADSFDLLTLKIRSGQFPPA